MMQPAAAVLVFPGTNGDRDLFEALTGAGFKTIYHHAEEPLPPHLSLAGLPGGFSYGDYWRAGVLASQCPAAVTNNSNLEPNEFFMLPVGALRDSMGNGTLDLCDPARGFKIWSTSTQQRTNRILNFAVMPGRNYQIQFANTLGGTWTNFPATNYAAPPQMFLNFTDSPAAGTPQRFYRVKLLP